MNVYVGIDPGKDGALVAIADSGTIAALADTPTLDVGKGSKRAYDEAAMAKAVMGVLALYPDAVFALEATHSMPGQGVSSMFSMGEGLGLWKGILAALGARWQLVTPQAWKRALMDGQAKEKAASCLVASRLFPDAHSALYTPRGKAIDGRGDALLIAEYLRRTHKG